MPDVSLRLEADAFDASLLQIAAVDGTERLGQLFRFEIHAGIPASTAPLSPETIRGADVALVWSVDDEVVHRVGGMVTQVIDLLAATLEYRTYRLVIAPRAHRLALVRLQDIFLDMSIPAIIEAKLEKNGLSDAMEMSLRGDYPDREFVLQYDETDLSFVSRLAEHLGMTLTFRHGDANDTLLFVDDNAAFPVLADPIAFRERGEARGVFELTHQLDATAAQYAVQDYNYRTPVVDLTASAAIDDGYGGGIVEYGTHHKEPRTAETLARIRREEVRAHQDRYTGKSVHVGLAAGHRFTIEGHPVAGDLDLLAVEVRHRARFPLFFASGPADDFAYANEFVAIPFDRPFRPRRLTPRPHMAGIYVALIQPTPDDLVGPSAQIDDEGRYRVRFIFDTKPREGASSHPIRMAQPHSGAGHGMHFPLRPGVEVAIAFANGDPDRPLIVGALDNPATKSPSTAKTSRANIISTASGITFTLHDSE
ncbi:MAG: type VI secretion system tip protein TssI/VgrG [Myxococcota bacterium]